MDFNSTVDIIIRDLNEASEIIDDLKTYPGVPALQVELAKSKCKSAAEVIALLKELKPQVEKPEEKTDMAPKKFRPLPEVEQIEKEKTVIVASVAPVASENITVNPESPVVTPVQAPAQRQARKKADSPIIADTFGKAEQRLNEQLSSRREESGVTEMMKSKPVANIGRAIGVNDKFLYIREVFNGDAEKYETAIRQIDSCTDFRDAYSVLQSHIGDAQENAVVKQLLELIRRKYPSE